MTHRHGKLAAGWVGGFLAVLATAGSVAASETPDASIEQCLACHRAGNPAAAVPLLEGQNEGYLRNQLRAFRESHREGFPMPAFAVDLDDATINTYAATLAALPWEQAPGKSDAGADHAAGAQALERHDCASCHGAAFLGAGDIPRLAGQNREYLTRQLRDFAREGRHHPPVGTGARMHHLEESEAEAIAGYLAALRIAPPSESR
jgi:cytochrome c553